MLPCSSDYIFTYSIICLGVLRFGSLDPTPLWDSRYTLLVFPSIQVLARYYLKETSTVFKGINTVYFYTARLVIKLEKSAPTITEPSSATKHDLTSLENLELLGRFCMFLVFERGRNTSPRSLMNCS